MSSWTTTQTQTFTITHARHMAAKVATDLKRMQRLYGKPSDLDIANYEAEVVDLIKHGYLNTVSYGFKRNNEWVEPTLRYTSQELALITFNDDDPGRVRPGANVEGASFYSYLTYTQAWQKLSSQEQDVFKKSLPFYRSGAEEPGVNGYFDQDKTYTAGGRALQRATVRSF